MIKEEYEFEEISEYLYASIDLLIAGVPSKDERSVFFNKQWVTRNKDVLLLKRLENGLVEYQASIGEKFYNKAVDLNNGIAMLLRTLEISKKIVMIELSSLDHVLIMYLTKQLVQRITPRLLFASYIRPKKYYEQTSESGCNLCDQIFAVKAIPGFAKRESENETLCSFLGFEGNRLKNVLESVHNIKRFIPIIAFPSGAPQWYNITMRNSMVTLQSEDVDYAIAKCLSESIFDAFNYLDKLNQEEKVVLAPLGTRPHSMACALFACSHPNSRIIHDYALEKANRAIEIEKITIYHLSMFLST